MKTLAKELISGLSDDPTSAALEFRDRIRALLKSGKSGEAEYIQVISIARSVKRNFGERISWNPPTYASNTAAYDRVVALLSSLDSFELSARASAAAREASNILDIENQIKRKETFGIAALNQNEKASVRMNIENIRRIIKEESLPERKKIALLSRLADLEAELETVGARTDRFFAFMGDAAFALGDFALKAKPFTDEVKSMLKIVLRSRETTESARLPRGEDNILLPSPDEGEDSATV